MQPLTQLYLFARPLFQVVSAIPSHLDGKSAPGQMPTGSVCYERNGVSVIYSHLQSEICPPPPPPILR